MMCLEIRRADEGRFCDEAEYTEYFKIDTIDNNRFGCYTALSFNPAVVSGRSFVMLYRSVCVLVKQTLYGWTPA